MIAQGYPQRYPALDSWRGIAALAVAVFHSTAYYRTQPEISPGLIVQSTGLFWLGVQVFFVISGYCIAAAAESAWRKDNCRATFLSRRIRRIFPPYLIWLAILSLVLLMVFQIAPSFAAKGSQSIGTMNGLNWLGNITLTESFLSRWCGNDTFHVTRVGWSLCYELQFYIVVFLLMFFRQAWFYRLILLISAICVGLMLVDVQLGIHYKLLRGTFLDGRWIQFALGVGVYWTLIHGNRTTNLLASILFASCGIGLTFWFLGHNLDEAMRFPDKRWFEFGICALFATVLIATRQLEGRLGNGICLGWLQKLGVISYSFYLVHWPICKIVPMITWRLGIKSELQTILLTVPISVAISTVAAAVFFRIGEKPFLNTRVVSPPKPKELLADSETNSQIGTKN